MKRSVVALILSVLCFVRPWEAVAQEPPLWPGAKYDPAIPTIKSVLGHDHGEVITTPEGVAQYLQALQKAAPNKTRLIEYARSWEGRPLWLFVIGSPERMAKLDQVKADLQRFGDPRRTPASEGDRLAGQLPVVVWLIHGVHGNEISSADASLLEAYHLLASQGDAGVDAVLRDALVLIDPMQNPDGRARFVSSNLQGRAVTPDPAPYSAEHDEPWPGGRSNHYLFDMNRDWFAQSQPETRGRIKIGYQSACHKESGRRLGSDRPRQRRALRRARLGVLRARSLRCLLSGLWRLVADLPGIHRHDLRTGIRARPGLRA